MSLEAEIHCSLSILKQTKVDESAVISPLSIALALALVHAGAGGNSEKEIRQLIAKNASDKQLRDYYKAVGDALLKKSEVKMNLANRIFIDKSFEIKQTYLDKIRKNFAAKAVNMDFQNGDNCSKIVNEFVEEATGGMIKDFIKPEDFNDTVFILINAIYFNGEWPEPFDRTFEENFYVKMGEPKKVTFMSTSDDSYPYVETDEVQMFSKNYKDANFEFVVILPKKRFNLAAVRKNLTAKKLKDLMNRLHPHLLHLTMPKFKIETSTPLVGLLKSLGVKEVFTCCAKLADIADDLFISAARHKAIIEVDENGTKAAAVTEECFGIVKCKRPRATPFKADHPFLFFLTHKKNIVFCGQYNG